ncbi:ACT domain-containing protein [Diplogelasinospora grovesii]|uniref:ACT domain-containing protein n=1 Tax=Diplogelasinospora grovesii TaxID=303347 RepID=A0AAN6NGJ8_9PEZI|nr:ACT domain-containing protein [Diplogelasinospora grovesii]
MVAAMSIFPFPKFSAVLDVQLDQTGADGTLSLIHVPLELYSTFLQPILQVLLPQSQAAAAAAAAAGNSELGGGRLEGLTVDNQHGFLNISVTPIECSIVCHSAWARNVFDPAIRKLPREIARNVSVSRDSYVVFSVISAGMDAGSRVVDLTSPLALAGIPIFFITTYYSDFILVPTKDRQAVVKTLLARGFVFSEEDESTFKSPVASASHNRGIISSSTREPPSTPPPSTLGELQNRTFVQLKKQNVVPYVEEGLRLIQCSGREQRNNMNIRGYERPSLSRAQMGMGTGGSGNGVSKRRCWVDMVDTKLYTSLVSALVSKPRFLSITLAQDDPPSLLLDKELLGMFGDSLVGPTEGDNYLVPIFLDLANLPFEATGIVSGVAGKLVQDMQMLECPELSYLSTARAGAVILSAELSTRALDILKPLLDKTPTGSQ